jgi:hypothetical protein
MTTSHRPSESVRFGPPPPSIISYHQPAPPATAAPQPAAHHPPPANFGNINQNVANNNNISNINHNNHGGGGAINSNVQGNAINSHGQGGAINSQVNYGNVVRGPVYPYLPGQFGTVVRAASPVNVVRAPAGYGQPVGYPLQQQQQQYQQQYQQQLQQPAVIQSPRTLHPQVVRHGSPARFGPAPLVPAQAPPLDDYYGRLESPRRGPLFQQHAMPGAGYGGLGHSGLGHGGLPPPHVHGLHGGLPHAVAPPPATARGSAIRESLNQLIDLIIDGRALEAFERFYAENCVMSENGENERVGKSACRAYEQEFLGSIQRWNDCQVGSVTVDGNTSAVEWVFDLSFFGGKRVVRRQVAVQTWAKGKIVHEVFYHA